MPIGPSSDSAEPPEGTQPPPSGGQRYSWLTKHGRNPAVWARSRPGGDRRSRGDPGDARTGRAGPAPYAGGSVRSRLVRQRPAGRGQHAVRARAPDTSALGAPAVRAPAVGAASSGRHARAGADTGTGSHAGLDPRADAGPHPRRHRRPLRRRPRRGPGRPAPSRPGRCRPRTARGRRSGRRHTGASMATAGIIAGHPGGGDRWIARRVDRVTCSLGFRMIRVHRAKERLWSIDRPASRVPCRGSPLP